MARSFDDNEANYLMATSAPLTSYPATLFAWLKTADNINGSQILNVMNNAGPNNGFWMFHSTSGTLNINTGDDDVNSTPSISAASFTNGVWYNVAATFTDDPTHQGWLDGVASPEQTDTKTTFTATPDRVGVGVESGSPFTNPFDGDISWPCIWDVKLGDGAIKYLAEGNHPRLIYPESIVWYCGSMEGTGNETDLIGSADLIETGTVGNASSKVLNEAPTPQIF